MINRKYYNTKLSFNKPINKWFYQWLVGFTDGDGSFIIDRQKNGKKWNLIFKISQKSNNAQILYFIKKILGCGRVSRPVNTNWSFRIRDINQISNIIFPIFDKYPLVSVKYYDYKLFKKAYFILTDNTLKKDIRNKLKEEIYNLLKQGPDKNFLSGVWENPNFILSKPWVTGFFEAEGSFYIVKKDEKRFSHGFSITLKQDKKILEQLCSIFHCSSKVKYNNKGFFSLDSTGYRTHSNIVNYFYTSEGINLFKGIKSLQFTIWRRTLKFKGDNIRLSRVQDKLKKFEN